VAAATGMLGECPEEPDCQREMLHRICPLLNSWKPCSVKQS